MAALCCTTTLSSNVGLTGDTIEEKTRCLLGWTKDSAPSYYTDGPLTQISSSIRTTISVPIPTPVVPGPVTPGTAQSLSQPRKSPRGCRTRAQTSSVVGLGTGLGIGVGGPTSTGGSTYPYSLLTFQSNRGHYNQGRKNSCPANLCDLDPSTTANIGGATIADQLTPPPSPDFTLKDGGTNWAVSGAPKMGGRHFGPISHQQHPSMSRRHSLDSGHVTLDHQRRSFDFLPQHHQCYHHYLPISPVSPKNGPEIVAGSAPTRQNLSPVGELFGNTDNLKNNKFQRFLFRTAANGVDLDTKLTQLKEEISEVGGPQQGITLIAPLVDYCDSYGSSSDVFAEFSYPKNKDGFEDLSSDAVDMPDDLRSIDVTAFKSLMLEGDPKTRLDRCQIEVMQCPQSYGKFQPIFRYNDSKPVSSFEKYANLDALSVDTSF